MNEINEMEKVIRTELEELFDEFNDFDVTVEPHYELRDIYICEVWAYSDDAVVNDIHVDAQGEDANDMAKDIALELYGRIVRNRKLA